MLQHRSQSKARLRPALFVACAALSCALTGQLAKAQDAPPAAEPPQAPAVPTALDIAQRMIARIAPTSKDVPPTPEELAGFDKTLEVAIAQDQNQPTLLLGRALVLRALKKPADALPLLKKVTELQPRNADAWYILGTCYFETIPPNAGLDALSISDNAREALGKAIDLDAQHVWARYALSQFYIQAPALVGGSYRKARELAKDCLAMPAGRGEFVGHLILANVAEHDEDWKVMIREYELAEQARGDGADPIWPITSLASALVRKKKDPVAAKPVLARYALLAPESSTLAFLNGEVARMEGRWRDAVPLYERVLATNAQAAGSRHGLAEAYEKLGDKAKAAEHYREFSTRFPNDERAKQAAKKAKQLAPAK